ncbi:MAG: rRNA maturation RNase YbeY [Ferruginibacter sp.]
MVINFFFNSSKIKVIERKRLRSFIPMIFKEEGQILSSLNYVFCTDEYLLSINKEFLNHDYYTDIITFTLSVPTAPIIGEVYISTDRVKYNSSALKVNFQEEIHRVIFHGALHLCGYKDKTSTHKKQMTAAEDKYLKMYFE